MSGWHYVVDGAAFGPADDAQLAAQLQDGTLSLETPVWREGMPGWTAVRAVPDALALASDPSLQLTQGSRRLAPPTSALGIAVPPPIPRTDDAAPGRKSLARTGFYLAVLGLIPILFAPLATTHMSHHGLLLILFIGVPFSVAGTAYGMLALRGPARARSSRVRRCAWIAIVLGELCVLGYLALLLFGDLVVSF